MRLLHARTLTLREFGDPAVPMFPDENRFPKYAILSHTWGSAEDEVSFADIQSPDQAKGKPGFQKISYCCVQALKNGIEYVWIDTCCIDKSSSAELSEAINSMFRWYKRSNVCYVYLSDVNMPQPYDKDIVGPMLTQLKRARWFTRGWTLQELLAPLNMEFFSAEWTPLGNKDDLSEQIERITGINERYIRGVDEIHTASVAQKMSWASKRHTKRVEDVAYSLLGLFDISMPLIYGEGNKAFFRLQHEIIRNTDDDTIFAWESWEFEETKGYFTMRGPLATSPRSFQHCADIVPCDLPHRLRPPSVTSRGVEINSLLWYPQYRSGAYLLLKCRRIHNYFHILALPVIVGVEAERDAMRRFESFPVEKWASLYDEGIETITLSQGGNPPAIDRFQRENGFILRGLPTGAEMVDVTPRQSWNKEKRFIWRLVDTDFVIVSITIAYKLLLLKLSRSGVEGVRESSLAYSNLPTAVAWEAAQQPSEEPTLRRQELEDPHFWAMNHRWQKTVPFKKGLLIAYIEKKELFGAHMFVVDVKFEGELPDRGSTYTTTR